VADVTGASGDSGPGYHRTIDRVTRILEEVVYRPGITFAELARALDAPKSSVHGFIRGLLARGWLHEDNRGFHLGPAVFSLTLASGHIRAGMVTQDGLDALHEETGLSVFVGVPAGDDLMYIGESGTDALTGFAARSNIRRKLISTAGGKALLAHQSDAAREAYLRRMGGARAEAVSAFLGEYSDIVKTRIAKNLRHNGAQTALATVVRNQAGDVVAAVVVIGPTATLAPREAKICKILLRHVDSWAEHKVTPREAI
jgi:DNA-binding IclR family transcriptional regulator